MSLQEALSFARQRLAGSSETAALDAQVLLAHLLGKSRAWVLAHPEARLSSEQEQRLQAYLARLEAGEPLPYVLGWWEFYGLSFRVSPAVLIPRPETELLVDQALVWLRAHPNRRLALDAGAGSGCIAVSLAAKLPHLRLVATDVSRMALQVARQNAEQHGVARQVDFVEADLFPPARAQFDLICSNPPYIPIETLEHLPVSLWEPKLALSGGPDGLEQIRRLVQGAPRSLAPGGLLLFEIEASQGASASGLAQQAFPQASVQVLKDLAGRDRLVSVQLPQASN